MLLVFFRTNWLSLTDSSGTRANVTPQRHATAAHCSFSARLLPCCADQEVRQPGPLLEVILARPARTAHANRFLHSPHPSPTTGGIHHQLFPLSKTSAPSRTTDMAPSQKPRSILRNTLHCCVFCFPFSFGEQVFDLFFVCFRPFSNKKKGQRRYRRIDGAHRQIFKGRAAQVKKRDCLARDGENNNEARGLCFLLKQKRRNQPFLRFLLVVGTMASNSGTFPCPSNVNIRTSSIIILNTAVASASAFASAVPRLPSPSLTPLLPPRPRLRRSSLSLSKLRMLLGLFGS